MAGAIEPTTDRLKQPDALERLCDAIIEGQMLREIALEWGVKEFRLRYWIAAEPSRAARVKAARSQAAFAYDEQAQKAIMDAKDDLDLKKAKELAHHLRWKASKMNPGEFGEKIEVGQPGDFSKSADDDLVNRLDSLVPGLGEHAKAMLAGGTARVH